MLRSWVDFDNELGHWMLPMILFELCGFQGVESIQEIGIKDRLYSLGCSQEVENIALFKQ